MGLEFPWLPMCLGSCILMFLFVEQAPLKENLLAWDFVRGFSSLKALN